MLRRPLESALPALVGVVHEPGVGAAARDGHLERVDDELGAQVVGDRPADDPAAVAVHHGGQVQPALPGPDVGDVGRPQAIARDRVEVALDQVRGGPHALDADRRLAASALDLPGQAGAAHQPLDALATDTDAVLEAQLGVHARRPIGLQALRWIWAIRSLSAASWRERDDGDRHAQA